MQPDTRQRKKFHDYNWTPFNSPIGEVLAVIKKDPMYEKPKEIIATPPTRIAHRYFAYHESKGHGTESCRSLQIMIGKFIKNGKLVRFLVSQRNQQEPVQNRQHEERRDQPPRYRDNCRDREEHPREL
jgi:hypothetical protein